MQFRNRLDGLAVAFQVATNVHIHGCILQLVKQAWDRQRLVEQLIGQNRLNPLLRINLFQRSLGLVAWLPANLRQDITHFERIVLDNIGINAADDIGNFIGNT